MTFQVGPVSIEMSEKFHPCRGKPMGEKVELDGMRLLAYMRTPDGGAREKRNKEQMNLVSVF